jgi:hypothetical protein
MRHCNPTPRLHSALGFAKRLDCLVARAAGCLAMTGLKALLRSSSVPDE